MRISDWSSDVCSSDLREFWNEQEAQYYGARPDPGSERERGGRGEDAGLLLGRQPGGIQSAVLHCRHHLRRLLASDLQQAGPVHDRHNQHRDGPGRVVRSEEHTSELQSLMRISYAVFCLKKKTIIRIHQIKTSTHYSVRKIIRR